MAKVKIQGHASGTGVLTVTAPNTSTDRTITLPDATGTLLNSDGDGSSLTGVADATKLPLAGGEMTGNVNHGDNIHARFGSGNDLDIYHDGSHSYVSDTGTGNLNLKGQNLKLLASNNDDLVFGQQGGAVTLYHNNVAKLATSATGIAVTGGVAIGGTGTANTLDDYEEGTWTPSIVVGSGLSIGTVHQNRYTKIGRTVTLNASFNIDSTSSPSSAGDVRIGGFPFAVSSFDNGGFPIDVHYNYKVTPCAFINPAGYMYYQNTTVGGNNQQGIGDALDASSVISLVYSYVTT